MQDPVIVCVRRFVQGVQRFNQQIGVFVQKLFYLFASPEIVPASLSKACAVLASVKPTRAITHLAFQPIQRAGQCVFKQRIPTELQRVGVDVEQLCVVIKYFFKMRCAPLSVLGVAKKATTQMIKKTTTCHLCQGGHDHL